MIVCMDIQAALAQRAGVGRYAKMLAEHLPAEMEREDALRLFYFDFKRKGQPFPVPGATARAVRWIPGAVVQQAWKRLYWPPFDWLAGRADVYHFPNFIRPPLRHGASVVTIHDVSFLRHPETTEQGNLRYLRARMGRTVERADRILAISACAGRELCELLGAPEEKVRAIPLGLSPNFRRPPDEDAIQAARERLRLERPYLLMVSTLEPRKNIPFLIEVFERLKGFDGDLVLAGMRGWKYQPILDRMHASPLARRIRHLDYVEEALLPGLYGGAELFVFPTLYEGFGFPPLEAMACGTPVVSSSASSLPEVLGSAALLVDDYDADHWAGVIARVLASPTQRAELRTRGLKRAAGFTWKETARRTWAVYRELAGGASSRADEGLT